MWSNHGGNQEKNMTEHDKFMIEVSKGTLKMQIICLGHFTLKYN